MLNSISIEKILVLIDYPWSEKTWAFLHSDLDYLNFLIV